MKLPMSLFAAAVVVSTAGCSSPPKAVVPDGSGRKPVNSEARIAEYRTRTGAEHAAAADRSALTRQVAYLQGEIQRLKMYVIQLSTIGSSSEALPPAKPASQAPVASQAGGRLTMSLKSGAFGAMVDSESLEVREGVVVFRVMQPYAKAEFIPSNSFQNELLARARESTRIDIRGRTDARSVNAADRLIAEHRALCARAFLVDNGIEPTKIHVSFLAAGDRVASNATAEGRAMNRRVEIETFGVNTHELLRNGDKSGDLLGRL